MQLTKGRSHGHQAHWRLFVYQNLKIKTKIKTLNTEEVNTVQSEKHNVKKFRERFPFSRPD
jgi:hypothetical protein